MGAKFLFFLLLPMWLIHSSHAATSLKIGFYNTSCPTAESVVRSAVASAVAANPGIAAGFIRLHFHDCFVRGCDGSVLIDSVGNNTAEKDSGANNPSLRGFETVDAVKTQLEATCPNTVSCADILAFAARDSASLVGGINYDVPSGRRDGRVSLDTEANDNLPPPTANVTELIDRFSKKNLTERDMVVLSGAHSIGVSHCSSFLNRIYGFNSTFDVDPTLNATLAASLRAICPSNVLPNDTKTVNMDTITPNVLDTNYYVGVTRNLGLFTSDRTLLTKNTSNDWVSIFIRDQQRWKNLFGQAMVKMGKIEVLTGKQGEIRKNCRVINPAGIDLILPEPSDDDSRVAAS